MPTATSCGRWRCTSPALPIAIVQVASILGLTFAVRVAHGRFVAIPLNVLLLPIVALVPPAAEWARTLLDKLGVHGVDPRTTPLEPAGTAHRADKAPLWRTL